MLEDGDVRGLIKDRSTKVATMSQVLARAGMITWMPINDVIYLRCQFHHDFMSTFMMQKLYMQLCCTLSLLYIFWRKKFWGKQQNFVTNLKKPNKIL